MADRVRVMSRGRAEQVAAPSVLYAQPSTAFVAEFVGVSSRVPVRKTANGVELFGRVAKVRGDVEAGRSEELDALLRPEDVVAEVSTNGLGVVNHRSFLGAMTRLGIGIGGVTVKVDLRSGDAADLELGARVDLSLSARDVLVSERRQVS